MTAETTLANEPARNLEPQAALQVGLTLEALIQIGHEAALHPADAAVKRAEKVGKLRAILDGFPAIRDALSEALTATTQERRARHDGFITVAQLTEALGADWNEKKVYRRLAQGWFPGVSQPGGLRGQYLIPADTVERLMAQEQNGKGA